MDLRLDFSNIPSRRNTDEIELLSPREAPLHEARRVSKGSNSARNADKDPLLPAVVGGKAPVSARPGEAKTSIKDVKMNKKKAVFQMKTVAVFPTKTTNSTVETLLPQVKTLPAERKAEKTTLSPKTKVKKTVMHELCAGSTVIEQEIALSESQLQLGAFPQRPALKKQDTSVVPDLVLLQRIRMKKADIMFTDSPVKGDMYNPSSPTTNTRVNTGHRSPSPSGARYARSIDIGEDGENTFSSPLHSVRTPSPSHRANPVLVISPYSSTARIADTPSQVLLYSAQKLKVAGFTIANTPTDKSPAGGSRKLPSSGVSSALDDQPSEIDAVDAQGSKVLKVSIPRAIKSPEKQDRSERNGDQNQLPDEQITTWTTPSKVTGPSEDRTLLGDGVSKKESPEQVKQMTPLQSRKPTAGQGSSPKGAGTSAKEDVLLAGADSDPSAFTAHSLADDFLMQLRFHDNFKHDKDRDGLRGVSKSPRTSAAPAQTPQVSYKQQELVVPSMPIKPKPQQSFMSATARRNLALRANLQKAGSSKVTAKNPSSPEGDSLEGQLKRRAVNDTLSGIRTGATKGGLFQGGENVDFYDLLNGSAAVSAGAEMSRQAQLARELEQEREKITNAEAAAELATQQAQLDPAVRAAIHAAQSVATKHGLLPMSPHSAVEKHGELLTEEEKEEVQTFSKVYFLGHSRDIKPPKPQSESADVAVVLNGGYDNSGGHYLVPVGDHIRFRYEVLGTLGKGSFGDVFRCRDHKLGIDVAVKVIKNQPIFTAQAEKELMVLNLIRNPDMDTRTAAEMSSENKATAGGRAVDRRHHHHMIQLVDSFEFRNHKCFVFPICGMNLYELLKSKNFAGLPMSFVRKVALQLLDALTHLRSLNVIHCDIKPENILLRNEQSAAVVLIDFGSSCMAGQSTFTYIQSRFYRSPEVLLGLPYGFEIDLWSVACILPELRTAYPAFPGESAADQLACITEVLGYPPEEMYQRCPRKERHFDDSGVLMVETSPRGQPRTPCSRSIETITSARRKDAQFVDFITACLKWLPEERLSLQQCSDHPWLHDGQAAEEESRSEEVLSPAARVRGTTEGEVLAAAHVPGPAVPVPMAGMGEADLIQKINDNADKARREIAEQRKPL